MIFKPQHTPEPKRCWLFSVLEYLCSCSPLLAWEGKIKPPEFPDPQALLPRCPRRPSTRPGFCSSLHFPKLAAQLPFVKGSTSYSALPGCEPCGIGTPAPKDEDQGKGRGGCGLSGWV